MEIKIEAMAIFQRDIWRFQLRDALIYWLYIPAGVIGSGLLLDRFFGLPHFRRVGLFYAAAVTLIGLGSWLMHRSIRDLERYGGGTPNPRRPPKRLVTKGVYRLCRHPMFLGYDLAALGVVLLWRSPSMLLASFPLMLIFEVLFLNKEEKYLARRYGESFTAYKRKTAMLLPAFHPGDKQ